MKTPLELALIAAHVAALYEALYTQPRLFCWVSSKPDGWIGQCEGTIANKRMDYNC